MPQNQRTIPASEIRELLETINEQFEILNSYKGKIPILEFDILKDNVRRLYETLIKLQKENDLSDIITEKDPKFGTGTLKPIEDKPETEEIKPLFAENPVPGSQEKEKADAPLEEPVKPDLFTAERSAFNDKLKEAREQSLGPRTGPSAPVDIKSLININDKFLFINDLFDGDYKEYTHAIEIFNNFDEKGEAYDFLDSLLKDNLWNSSSAAFLRLKEIVEKRFN